MAVDLSDYTDSLFREVNPPGTNLYPDATDSDWIGYLADAFWEARIDGILPLNDYVCDADGIVTPKTANGADIGRDLVQLVILWAGFRILRNVLRNLRTQFRAQAGPASYEYQQSANTLAGLLSEMTSRRDIILMRLSDLGTTNDVVIDTIVARDESFRQGLTHWVGSGFNAEPPIYR